jgi:hypothetical protein
MTEEHTDELRQQGYENAAKEEAEARFSKR